MQQPVTRFCPSCGTDVEDVGGFCMLGHNLKVSAPTADLSTLRAEVDAAFEEAKLQVAAALGGSSIGTSPVPSPAARPRPEVDPRPAASPSETVRLPDVPAKTPPPPPPDLRVTTQPVAIPQQPVTGGSDPIAAFAPPPHMDWGPNRKRFGRRK